MAEHKFFLLWDLRRGAITISWIQMIISAFTIAGLISYFQNAFHFLEDNDTLDYNAEFIKYEKYIFYMNLSVTYEIIKLITTISLIFGIVRKYPLFYQPWLTLFLIENLCFSILFISLFPMIYNHFVLLIAPTCGLILLGIRVYIYISIYKIYKIDFKNSNAMTYEKNIDFFFTKLESNEDA